MPNGRPLSFLAFHQAGSHSRRGGGTPAGGHGRCGRPAGFPNELPGRAPRSTSPITRPSPEEATRVIRRALDLGFNLIDTAIGYKESEERIGRGIAGRRDQVILATKSAASASLCTECAECEAKCPYGLPIRDMLEENAKFHFQTVDQNPAAPEGAR